jgi:hypothetical protein
MFADHDLPCGRISILKSEPLGVWPIGHDSGIFPFLDGAINVRAQDKTVIHGDWDIPVNCHSVARFGDFPAVSHGLDFIQRRYSLNIVLMHRVQETLFAKSVARQRNHALVVNYHSITIGLGKDKRQVG